MNTFFNFLKKEINRFNSIELIGFAIVTICIMFNAVVLNDSTTAIASAICGILYTIYAGKGRIICYLFGLMGSGFYAYLAFDNALWGNLGLYLIYYIPIQLVGIVKWSKNLKPKTDEIYKTKLNPKERIGIFIICSILFAIISILIKQLGGSHPYMDGAVTAFSVTGMYLTVRRCIEQWVLWTLVNAISVVLWFGLALSGQKVYSTVLMWCVYLGLGIYFYYKWKQEVYKSSP